MWAPLLECCACKVLRRGDVVAVGLPTVDLMSMRCIAAVPEFRGGEAGRQPDGAGAARLPLPARLPLHHQGAPPLPPLPEDALLHPLEPVRSCSPLQGRTSRVVPMFFGPLFIPSHGLLWSGLYRGMITLTAELCIPRGFWSELPRSTDQDGCRRNGPRRSHSAAHDRLPEGYSSQRWTKNQLPATRAAALSRRHFAGISTFNT